LKFISLYSDIYVNKPAFDLKEGVFFTHIPNYAIKISKKDPDGKTIHNVIIFEQNNSLQDNCIVAKKGEMKISEDGNYLEFNLEDGCRYQENGNIMDSATEFTRLSFKKFKKLFDLSVLRKQETNDSLFSKNFKMLSANQLSKNIDSLEKSKQNQRLFFNQQLNSMLAYSNLSDSIWKSSNQIKSERTYAKLIPDSLNLRINQYAINKAVAIKGALQQQIFDSESKDKELRFHEIEWHRKYSISLACLVLFFIGAPLGAIIRKGGLGMPLVVAIVFFLIFHLLNMFGEKFSRDAILSPGIGMWLAILILAPIGVFLTHKAMNDSQLFNKEFYLKLFKFFKKVK